MEDGRLQHYLYASAISDILNIRQMFILIIVVQMIAALLYVAYLIHQYALPQVSPVVKILVYFTWLASFSIVVLLPFDIYHSMQGQFDMGAIWRVIYYSIMVLTWIILPVAQEYQTAGEFTVKERIRRAIINNLIIYGVFAVLGVAFFIYLFIKGQLNLQELLPLAMAASNAFGMFLVVIFLSHGLVAIPRMLWRQKKLEIKLKQKQFSAVGLSDKKSKVLNQLELKVKELYWYEKKNGESPESNFIVNLIPERYRQQWRKNIPDLGQIDLIRVHRDIKELMLQLARLERRWEELSFEAFMIEDIMANTANPNKRVESTLITQSKYDFVNTAKWVWHCKVKPVLHPLLAVFFSMFALAVIVAELGIFIPALAKVNPFGPILNIKSVVLLDCSLMIVMAYIVFCVYYSLFKLKFASFYGLYWNKQTDASSLLFFAINASRISTPLCYNFLQIVDHLSSSFSNVMGEANIVPVFGQTFFYIFPILLLLLILVNTFEVYTMIARVFGLQKFQFESAFNHENIEEGKKLLQKARSDLENRILNSNSKDLKEYRSYKWEVLVFCYSTQNGLGSEQSTKKESSSSEQIALKGAYFNHYRDMDNAAKIMAM